MNILAIINKKYFFMIICQCLLTPNLFANHNPTPDTSKTINFTLSTTKESNLYRQSTQILHEAFKRLGYNYNVSINPHKRSIALMKNSLIDGDGARIYDFNKNNLHPYYLRVDEAISEIFWSVLTVNPDIKINKWDDLKNGSYRVGYLSGVKYSEQKLIGVINPKNLYTEPFSNTNGINLLIHNRIDAYIYANPGYVKNSFLQTFNGITIYNRVLTKNKLFPYLHIKNKKLKNILEQKIREIKQEGIFKQNHNPAPNLPKEHFEKF